MVDIMVDIKVDIGMSFMEDIKVGFMEGIIGVVMDLILFIMVLYDFDHHDYHINDHYGLLYQQPHLEDE